jgi:hypothetical protein
MAFELSALLESKLNNRLPLSALQGNRTVTALAEQLGRVLATAAADNKSQQPATTDAPLQAPAAKGADIRLCYLAPTLLIERDTRFDAAALTYIPEKFTTKGGLGPAELQAALGREPFLSGIVEAPIGRVGTFMLPLRAPELFLRPEQTRDLVFHAMELASQQGSRVMTLTGLLPAATGYGEALKRHNGHSDQPVTTGHALTTATIIANLTDLLRRCGRRLEQERLAVVGLGSVGRSVLELLFRTLPHPSALVLCDLYVKADDLKLLSQKVRDQFKFDGDIEIVAGDAGLPSAVRDTRLIVSAVDRADVIDSSQLAPGTILLDDSYPPTFDPALAWRRMNESQDVIIASGGFARLPGPVRETFYVPNSARPFLRAYGEDNFISAFQREPCDYTACIFAGPLALKDSALRPETGIPTPMALEAFYRAFERYDMASAAPQCNGRLIPDWLFEKFRMRVD